MDSTNPVGVGLSQPEFKPRIPPYLSDKLTPFEKEVFERLDVNSQQTEFTMRVVMEGAEERKKVMESVTMMQIAHADHCAQDKIDFGDLRDKHGKMADAIQRCAESLERWDAKIRALSKVFNFFFGRKGLVTAVVFAVVTWMAVEYTKAHLAAANSPVLFHRQGK